MVEQKGLAAAFKNVPDLIGNFMENQQKWNLKPLTEKGSSFFLIWE
jgi:hypothetical protein